MFYFMDTNDYIVVSNKFEINEDAMSGKIKQIDSKAICHMVDSNTHDILKGSTPVKYFTSIPSGTVLVPEDCYGKYLIRNEVSETKISAPEPVIVNLANKSGGTLTLPNLSKTNILPREFSGTSPKRAF
jgi:hypothetical protein